MHGLAGADDLKSQDTPEHSAQRADLAFNDNECVGDTVHLTDALCIWQQLYLQDKHLDQHDKAIQAGQPRASEFNFTMVPPCYMLER